MLTSATLVLLMLGLAVAACGGGGSGDTTADTVAASGSTVTTGSATSGSEIEVIMANRAYDPDTVTIKVGDTVTWINEDAPRHDVVADNGEFKSDLFDKGQSFSFTFTTVGTYPYHCTIHPGMTGTIIVQ